MLNKSLLILTTTLLSAIIHTKSFTQNSDLEQALRKVENKTTTSSIKHVDFIYLINLDNRPEKWNDSISQLKPYNILPHRFSAVLGKSLSPELVNNIILKFTPNMEGERWISYFPHSSKTLTPEFDFLNEKFYEKPCISSFMSPGAIGCTLSHLSILQDAYTSGYETIWIMEDDILVEKNPHHLSNLIEKLDQLVGKEGWDILYTDSDKDEEGEGDRDLKHDLSHIWRPDAAPSILKSLAKREIINEDFMRIKSRCRTHSMIVRRSGMKKILDYMKTHLIFAPYDDELSLIPNLNLFNLGWNCVSFIKNNPISDTQADTVTEAPNWSKYKQETLLNTSKISGWHFPPREAKLMDFIYDKKPKTCIEIGAFGGLISYQIAKTLHFLEQGVLHAIDGWDSNLALEGVKEERMINLWETLKLEKIYQEFQNLISSNHLEKYCQIIRQDSKKAASSFKDESIDFLYIDGNLSKEGSLSDVLLYFPKVKKGGYIWVNSADLAFKQPSIAFLMKNCQWLKETSVENKSVVFQKSGS